MSDDLDGFAAKLLAAVSRARPAGGDDDDNTSGGKVPVERLRREIDKRKAMEAQLADIGEQVKGLQTNYAAEMERFKTGTADEVKRISMLHAEDLGLVDQGLTDPLGRQALRMAWEAAPKDARGKSPAEWWQGITAAQAAHMADPKANPAAPAIPRVLSAYLPAPAADPPKAAPKGTPAGPGKPQANGLDTFDPAAGVDAFFASLRGQA